MLCISIDRTEFVKAPPFDIEFSDSRIESKVGFGPYMPHMSLLYGDLTDEEKEKIVERAKSLDPEICNLSFEVSYLTLYESDTDDLTLKSWRKVADIELSGN
ncbi:hypothetical protein ACLOJK_008638 [Asimina triloba]